MAIRIIAVLLALIFLGWNAPEQSIAGNSGNARGLNIAVKGKAGRLEHVELYKGSHALLIGVSRYSAGWPMLESIPGELEKVETFLAGRGFQVRKILDPDGEELAEAFEEFINDFGFVKDNRLLFFFSGHGYTRSSGRRGYLVPVDAPDPDQDLTGFLKKGLGMNQVLSWARDIEAKHALFLFDSCFSGTIFKQKSRTPPPRHITRLTVEPVRQFITAGGAGEEVPANSTFTPVFIDGLRYGLADLNRDGYVSATELGIYLQTEVPQYTDQNPQFGKIRDYDLSRGDFIFMTDQTYGSKKAQPEPMGQSKAVISQPIISGLLRVESLPIGAGVYLDGELRGQSPVILSNVAPGSHEIRVQKEGFFTESRTVEIAPGQHVPLRISMVAVSGATGGGDVEQGEVSPEVYIAPVGDEIEKRVLLSPLRKKVIRKQPAGLPSEIAGYIEGLRSANSEKRRYTAKVIYRQNVTHPAVLEEVERQLINGYLKYPTDRQHLDALAWMCNILGRTNSVRYKGALSRVASSETPRKVRRYAEKNLRILEQN